MKKKAVKKKRASKDRLEVIEKSLKSILKNQKEFLKNQKLIEKQELEEIDLEKKQLIKESNVEDEEMQEIFELKKIEELEKEIEKEAEYTPLKRITYRDITKGIIGAFFGIVGHFAFAEGAHLSEHFSWERSTLLFVVSLIIIILFLYFTGFRKVDDKFMSKYLPIRAIIIYASAIITVFIVLLLYGTIDFHTPFQEMYNTVASISILAILGAGTADLIGKNEE